MKVCEVCERRVGETVEYLVLVCEGYKGARDKVIGILIKHTLRKIR